MSGKKKKSQKAKDGASVESAALEAPLVGSKSAYDKFAALAQEIDRRELLPMRGDVWLAYHNARAALDAVMSREATIKAELPAAGVEGLREMPELALAVAFADEQVERASTLAEELDELVHRARRLRKRLLKSAVALAEAGVVPESDLEKIRRGDGPVDAADDLLELAALLGSREGTLKKKHAVPGKKLAESLEIGAEIKGRLQPGGPSGNGAGSAEVAFAEEMRDRLWTLLNDRYQRLWRVGAYLFGQSVEERLPALQSRAALRKGVVKTRKS